MEQRLYNYLPKALLNLVLRDFSVRLRKSYFKGNIDSIKRFQCEANKILLQRAYHSVDEYLSDMLEVSVTTTQY